MNGLSYTSNNEYGGDTHSYNGKLGGGGNGYDHVEDGGDSYNDDDPAFGDSNNIDSYFDQEADENQGLEDDADLDGYLNDLYGSESAGPDHHGGHDASMTSMKPAVEMSGGGGGSKRHESTKGLYEIAVKKVNNENVYEYTCKICSKLTIGSKEILRHLKREHGKEFDVYECKACDFATQYRASLNRHKRSVHGIRKPAIVASSPAVTLNKTLMAKLEVVVPKSEAKQTNEEITILDSNSQETAANHNTATTNNNNSDHRRSLRSSNSQLNKQDSTGVANNDSRSHNGHHNGLNRTHSGISLSQNGGSQRSMNGGSQSNHTSNGSSNSRFGQSNGFSSSFRRPIVTVSHIYKKYQCSACSLKSKNLFDIRKHINQKHKGQADVQMNSDYVGHYKKIVSKYNPIARPSYNGYASSSNHNNHNNHANRSKDAGKQQQQNTADTTTGSSRQSANGGANYMDTTSAATTEKRATDANNSSAMNTSNHSFNDGTNGETLNQNGGDGGGYETKDEAADVNPAVQDFRALLNQYELRLTGLDMNYRTLNMNVVNIDTRLTTLDSRIVRIEDKLETILKLLQQQQQKQQQHQP